MNLSQIERRFQCVDFMASYVNYKYNPHIAKVKDLKQHIHKELMYKDSKHDQAIYGLAAFQEGDPAEIVRGSQKMSVIGGRGVTSSNTFDRNKSTHNTSQNMTLQKGSQRRPNTRSTIQTEVSQRDIDQTSSQAMLNQEFLKSSSNAGRPFTSKLPQTRPAIMSGGQTMQRTRSTNSRWTISRPLRNKQKQMQFSTDQQSNHLIHRSKLNMTNRNAQPDKISTSEALGRYYAKQMKQVIHAPQKILNPTVYYKAGQNLKSETDFLLQSTPLRPKHFLMDQTQAVPETQGIDFRAVLRNKEEDYDNLMKQLYKIKIPEQILTIIRQANPHILKKSDIAAGDQLMQLINTEYIQALASDKSSKFISSQEKSKIQTNASVSLGDMKGQSQILSFGKRKSSTIRLDDDGNTQKNSTEHRSKNISADFQIKHKIMKEKQKMGHTSASVPDQFDQTSLDYDSLEGLAKLTQPLQNKPIFSLNENMNKQTGLMNSSNNAIEPSQAIVRQSDYENKQKNIMTADRVAQSPNSMEFTLSKKVSDNNNNGSKILSSNSPKKEVPAQQDSIVNQKTTFNNSTMRNKESCTPDNKTQHNESPVLSQFIKSQKNLKVNLKTETDNEGKLLFNLKITDLTTTDNPFVFYENQEVDDDGYLLFQQNIDSDQSQKQQSEKDKNLQRSRPMPKASVFKSYNNLRSFGNIKKSQTNYESEFDELDATGGDLDIRNSNCTKNGLNATIMLPWLKKPSDLEKRTLKIEVTFKGELILLRIIHIDKLYPVQYPMIALRIANNMIQSNLLRENKISIDPVGSETQAETKYIQVGHNIGKRLQKASSVATYDTQQTQQILKASGALEDPVTSLLQSQIKDDIFINNTQQQQPMEVTENVFNKALRAEAPVERSHVVMKTRNSQFKMQTPIQNPNTSQESQTIIIKTDLPGYSNIIPPTDIKQTVSAKQQNGKSITEHAMSENFKADLDYVPQDASRQNLLCDSTVLDGQKKHHVQIQNQQKQEDTLENVNIAIQKVDTTDKTGINSSNYFVIKPQKNAIYNILQELQNFDLNILDVSSRIRDKHLLQFPEIMKNLQLIIEFSDCIIQAKDLINYDIVIDENHQRAEKAIIEAAELRQGLPNEGLIQGVQCSPAKVPQKYGIIKENQKDVNVRGAISQERKNDIKSYLKSSAANYYVLKNTSNTLARINEAQRQNLPVCAQTMKTKKDQFYFLQNSKAFKTQGLVPMERQDQQQPLKGRVKTRQQVLREQAQASKKILIEQTFANKEDKEIHDVTLNRFNSGSVIDANSPTDVKSKMLNNLRHSMGSKQSEPSGQNLGDDPFRNSLTLKAIDIQQTVNSKLLSTRNDTNNYQGIAIDGTLPLGKNGTGEDEIVFQASEVQARSMKNLLNNEDNEAKQPQAVYCNDQIVVIQGNKDLRKKASQQQLDNNEQVKQSVDFYIKQSNKALVRQGTNNSDLEILKDPNIRPQKIEPIQITSMVCLNSSIAMPNQNSQDEKIYDHPSIRDSADYLLQGSSLLKNRKQTYIMQNDEGELISSENLQEVDTKAINSPIGPIAYVSKYHQHSNNNPNSSIQTNHLREKNNESTTNYGLASNRQVTPLVQQQEPILGQSFVSQKIANEQLLSSTKRPHQSVLQHQNYGERRSSQKMSHLMASSSQNEKPVQMLAPIQNYLYRGSNARKTVRDLLDAKQESDAAMLYEAITKKKFDVPATRQDFNHPRY